MTLKMLLVLLGGCFMISGCSALFTASAQPVTPTPKPHPTVTMTKLPPTPTPRPYRLSISQTVEIHLPQPSLPSPTQVSTLTVAAVNWVFLDEQYVYWTELQHHQHIFRYPLNGGQRAPIVTTKFTDGDLTAVKPIRRGDWLIFVDAEAPLDNAPFLLRALNLKTSQEQTLLDSHNNQYSLPSLGATADQVVWTTTTPTRQANCTASLLVLYDLHTQKAQELDRACLEDHYMWMFPSLSNEYLVVEQDRPTHDGATGNTNSDIYLYSLATKHFTALSHDGHSGIPDISGPWVVWQNGARFELPKSSSIFNLNSGIRRVVDLGLYSIHIERERWVYWVPAPGSPLYAYDLATDKFMIVSWRDGRVNQSLDSVTIYQNRIAWWRNLTADDAILDGQIEWRSLP